MSASRPSTDTTTDHEAEVSEALEAAKLDETKAEKEKESESEAAPAALTEDTQPETKVTVTDASTETTLEPTADDVTITGAKPEEKAADETPVPTTAELATEAPEETPAATETLDEVTPSVATHHTTLFSSAGSRVPAPEPTQEHQHAAQP